MHVSACRSVQMRQTGHAHMSLFATGRSLWSTKPEGRFFSADKICPKDLNAREVLFGIPSTRYLNLQPVQTPHLAAAKTILALAKMIRFNI